MNTENTDVNGNFSQIVTSRQIPVRKDFVSDELFDLFTLIIYVILCGPISVFGIIFNVINIIVFAKQGFGDPMNITLLGLAIADSGSLLSLVWMSICYNPFVVQVYRHLDFQGIQHITAGWPHVCFTRITSWITAFITLERFLCVALPLKVKSILTPRRTAAIVISIFIIMVIGLYPVYIGIRLDYTFNNRSNHTWITLVYDTNGRVTESASLSFNTAAQLTAFTLVIICTSGLVHLVQTKTKWRHAVSSSGKNESVTRRDRTLVKMVIFISVIFIVSFSPTCAISVLMIVLEDYNPVGRYQNTFLTSSTFSFFLEGINSTVNIFVYLKMSSKYRKTFLALFQMSKKAVVHRPFG